MLSEALTPDSHVSFGVVLAFIGYGVALLGAGAIGLISHGRMLQRLDQISRDYERLSQMTNLKVNTSLFDERTHAIERQMENIAKDVKKILLRGVVCPLAGHGQCSATSLVDNEEDER